MPVNGSLNHERLIFLAMKNIIVIIVWLFLFSLACQPTKQEENVAKRNKEAREDSLEMVETYKYQAKITNSVAPDVETVPVSAGAMDDAADDPAFWFNVGTPDSSLVFGSNKKGGVYAYYLSGAENGYYPVGKINNIDIRQSVIYGNDMLDILSGSNRTDNSIIVYTMDKKGNLSQMLENQLVDPAIISEVYGYCMYKNPQGEAFFIVNGKNGFVQAYSLEDLELKPWRSWKVDTQPEGMVADDQLGFLYVGEEEKGIWKINLKDENAVPQLIEASSSAVNKDIRFDIEGLSIYYGEGDSGFLLASSQGSFSYAIFDRVNNHYIGSFTIKGNDVIDGVEETDGLDIYSWPVGDAFPNGLAMVQDGFNYNGDELKSQNFKLIDLGKVLELYMQSSTEK